MTRIPCPVCPECGARQLGLLDAAAERDALAAKVDRVRALHFGEYVEDEDQSRCFECGDDYPCPTIRALGGAES